MLDEFVGMIVAGVAVTATTIAAAVISHKKKTKTKKNTTPKFNENGFDVNGKDAAEQYKSYYIAELEALDKKLYTVKKRMDESDFESACILIRKSLEKAIKLYLEHWDGYYEGNNLYSLIDECEEYFDKEFISKLHSARMHCNDAVHDSGEEKTYNQIYFCYKVLEEMIGEIKDFTS